ncbi:MAG: MarR family winged helix-turn-helix transcriptional regulator [Candidatus Sericytochromatia bacterium]
MSSLVPVARHLDAIMRITRRLAGELADETGMTLHQLMALGMLAERGRCTMSELKSVLEVTTGAVTGLVDRLERQGLVVRAPSDEDRRVTYLSLTEAGSAAIGDAWLAYERRLTDWLARVPDAERLMVAPVLEALAAAGLAHPAG